MIPSGNPTRCNFCIRESLPVHTWGGDQILMFAYGNLSESPFKDLDADEAVSLIYPASLTRNSGIGKGCPHVSTLFAATSRLTRSRRYQQRDTPF
jgi:hypothetical protein